MKYLFAIAALFLMSVSITNAEESVLSGLRLNFVADYLNSSSYYDTNGNAIGEINEVKYDDGSRDFDSYKFTSYSFAFGADYQISDFLNLNFSVPMRMYYYDEKPHYYFLDTIPTQDGYINIYPRTEEGKVDQYRHSQLEHINLGTVITPLTGDLQLDLLFNIIIPFGKNEFNLQDPELDLWYDGTLEILTGAGVVYKFDRSKVYASTIYNYRDEGFSDRLGLFARYSFSSIEDTDLNFIASYQTSLGDYKDEYAFNSKYPSLWDNYLNLGMGFGIDPSENVRIYMEYQVKILGANTDNSGFFRLISSYAFK